MPAHRLHAIIDVEVSARFRWHPLDVARACVQGGARVLQLRAKTQASGPFVGISDQFVALARSAVFIIVNDRVDLARLSGASGVHVGQDDLPPAAAREQLGHDAIIGFSTHSAAQLEAAVREPVSYLAVGPVFGTATKHTGYDAVGLDLVAEGRRVAGGIPVVAIGGVTLDNARSVVDAGAAAVAVISDLLAGGDPESRVKAYLRALT
jgi:thiamine-phosphate pyrophosphorylase